MDDKQYAKRALILALTAFVLASFPITIPILAAFISIGYNVSLDGKLRYVYGFLVAFSWIPGLIIAVVALKMGQHMKGSITLLNITRISTALALFGNICFGIFEIIAILLAPYAPGW